MGITLGPVFNKKFPEDKEFGKYTDGKDLVHAMDRFDEICAAKGVTLFSKMAGPDEDEMDEMIDELDEGESLEDTWFTCADGIKTVRAIIAALESEKQWSKGFRPNQVRNLLECLQKLEEILEIGKKKRAKFYFLLC